jgi:uncharacterized protein with ParB-like and HNH nuclease domain
MNSGKYQLKAFLTDHNLDQIIIPEIQRDYVWQEENVIKLLKSIKLNSDRQRDMADTISEEQLKQLPPEAQDILIRAMEDKKHYCNVGFLYAYFDPELAGRFVLIDGQQRMTTLFLLLLSICVKEKKAAYFRQTYFKDGILKFDYKVRDDAHEFLVNFVNHILLDKSSEAVSNENWHYTEYDYDSTIQSILTNYSVINNFVRDNELPLEYVENYIEFWYFDTNKSKQGEELYIYMNSRGESVSPNESIKANLLKGHSEEDKHNWGTKWEKWQNLFWVNRSINPNADRGLEEFLKWIQMIQLINSSGDGETMTALVSKVRNLKESKKISIESLTFALIERYITALELLISHKDKIGFRMDWLSGRVEAVDYMKLIPMFMYAEKYPDTSPAKLNRYSRFFLNTSKFDLNSKSPYIALVNSVNLSQEFLDNSKTDVSDLILYNHKAYDNLLTAEEIIKFKIYKTATDNAKRIKLEELFWSAEDYKLCDGRITFLWDYIDYYPNVENVGNFDIDLFEEYYNAFRSIYNKSDDFMRRALLTKGDYSDYDGRTSSLEGDRYSFCNEDWRWRYLFTVKSKAHIFKSFINDYVVRSRVALEQNSKAIFVSIIAEYLKSKREENWEYNIIKHEKVLSYCRQKFICFTDAGTIYLLQDRNAAVHNFIKLREYLN